MAAWWKVWWSPHRPHWKRPSRPAFGSFDAYLWAGARARPQVNRWNAQTEVPAVTPEAIALSKDLRRRGFVLVAENELRALRGAAGKPMDAPTASAFSDAVLAASKDFR